MPAYPLIKFVDRPDPAAVVRLDVNTWGVVATKDVWPTHDGFTLGAPSFEGVPGGYGGQYGPRAARFGVVIRGNRADATAAMSAIARELLREGGNWLFFQLTPGAKPMWLRTYQSGPEALSFEALRDADTADTRRTQWGVGVALVCDPFMLGARVTPSPVTINNDIAHASNPLMARLPAIEGDAPTPLRILTSVPPANKTQLLAMVSVEEDDPHQASYTTPIRITGGWDMFNGTTQVSDAAMSGGVGYRVSFAGVATLASRLVDNTAALVGPSARMYSGRLRAFVRVGKAATNATYQVQLGQYAVDGPVWNDAVTVAVTPGTAFQWVDVGEIQYPFANPLTKAYADLADLGSGLGDLSIRAARTVGTADLDIDSLLLIPAHLTASPGARTSLALIERGEGMVSASGVYYDAEEDRIVILASGALVHYKDPPVVKGSLPWAVPGFTNILHYLRSMTADVLTDSTVLTISYQPRWLWMAS
jgi:hypothetical protein